MCTIDSQNTRTERILTEREIIKQVLKIYKKSPCLWNTLSNGYYNKNTRREAYQKILKKWSQLVPGITLPEVKKKIDNMRATYRRERKIVEYDSLNLKDPDARYKPKLWYYDLLSFLNDNTNNNTESEDEEETYSPPKKRPPSDETLDVGQTDAIGESEKIEEYVAKWHEPSYDTTYGLTIAKQLNELEDNVRYEAERIISDVIYRARTGTLPKYTAQAVDSLIIPQSGPSWYDGPCLNTDHQQPAACMVVKVDPDIKTQSENADKS